LNNDIQGKDANDILSGLDGDDLLKGFTRNDQLLGGNGNDQLFGGNGLDTLTGGAGNDVFAFDDIHGGKVNLDRIMDFNVAEDTIQLDHAVFTRFTTAGALDAGNFVSGATARAAHALDANDFLIYNTTTGTLSYDANGNAVGGVVNLAVLVGVPALTADDFVIA